jgi:carbamoyltransferase
MASWWRRSKNARWLASPTPDALPQAAIPSALEVAGLTPADVNCVALVRPFAQQIHLTLRAQFPNAQTLMVEHHAAHAASAYYPSPFDEATVLTLDRDGDFRSAARWHAAGNQLHLEKDLYYPDSLGDLYSRVTELLGFDAGADEHKVQWLVNGRFRRAVSAAVRGTAGIERLALH